MEEKNNQLVKSAPAYIQKSLETLESSLEYAKTLVNTKLVPNHFYEKGSDGKPDYTKGKPEAVLLVIQHGMELGLSISQALQQVVPVNGLMTVKGDGAKALIMGSGKCKSWVEEETGSISGGDYEVTITSEKINGEKLVRKFNLEMAKRAGLYYDPRSIPEKIAYAYKFSPWYKYTERMVRYRAIGFMARDLYPEVLNGTVTYEEAQDYPKDNETIIETPGGKLILTESKQNHLNEVQDKITKNAASNIKPPSFNDIADDIPEISETVPDNAKKEYTEEELSNMGSDIYKLAKEVLPPVKEKILSTLPGKKSNKLYREAILAYQEYGNEGLDAYINKGITSKEDSFESKPFEVLELNDKGERDFKNITDVFNYISDLGCTDEQVVKLFPKYKDREDFSTRAHKDEISEMIMRLM